MPSPTRSRLNPVDEGRAGEGFSCEAVQASKTALQSDIADTANCDKRSMNLKPLECPGEACLGLPMLAKTNPLTLVHVCTGPGWLQKT